MAVVMLGATDEHFQTIASHLSAMSGLIIRRTASTVADTVNNMDTNRRWLAWGGIAGLLISVGGLTESVVSR